MTATRKPKAKPKRRTDPDKLTAAQEAFCQRVALGDKTLVQCWNETVGKQSEATVKSRQESASKLMSLAKIGSRVEELQIELRKKAAAKFDLTAESVSREIARIAFFDIRKLFDGARLKDVGELDEDTARALAGLEAEVLEAAGGENEEGDALERTARLVRHKFKIASKMDALKLAAQILGMTKPAGEINVYVGLKDRLEQRRKAALGDARLSMVVQ